MWKGKKPLQITASEHKCCTKKLFPHSKTCFVFWGVFFLLSFSSEMHPASHTLLLLLHPYCIPQFGKKSVQPAFGSLCTVSDREVTVNKNYLSQTCISHQWTQVCVSLRWWWQLSLVWNTSYGFPGTLHQCTVWGQANLHDTRKHFTPVPLSTRPFRTGPMTDCDVARVFGQNGAIQTAAGGREKPGVEQVRERERRVRQETRQSGGERRGEARRDRRRGWKNWQSSHWQQWGLLDNPGILSEINLSSWSCWVCHYDVVLALSQWQFVQCFPSSPYYCTVERSLPSIHLCLLVCLSPSLLINCPHRALQPFYRSDLQRNRRLMTRTDVLLQEHLLHHRFSIFPDIKNKRTTKKLSRIISPRVYSSKQGFQVNANKFTFKIVACWIF